MKSAVFLDRDGVLVKNIDRDYIRNTAQITVLPFVNAALAKLHAHGFELVIVTNQACVEKGVLSLSQVWTIQHEIVRLLDPERVMAIKSEICPHMSESGCSCRKPQPGMLLAARDAYNLDERTSYLIGDAISDVQAAEAANVQPLFVLSGRGTTADLDTLDSTTPIFNHIGDAADYICEGIR